MDIPYWSESEWLRRLIRRAREYAVCDADAEDFAHACVCAFRRHFQIFPWESSNPLLAWRWCCQKLRSLSMDYARRTARCPQVAFSDLAEDAIVAEVEKETLETLSVEEFLSALPRVQREALQLRLEGYSWEETAQILGKPSSTLRSYLPSLKAKFREFFGYDPSNQPSQSLISVEGRESPHPVLVGQNDEHSKTDATDTDASSKTRGGGGQPSNPIHSQRQAVIEKGKWDAYDWHGYCGSVISIDKSRDSYFAVIWDEEDLPRE